jgi:hypothetical protein
MPRFANASFRLVMHWSLPFSRSYIARSLASNSASAREVLALLQAVARVLGFFWLLSIPHPLIAPLLALIAAIMLTDRPIDAAIERIAVGFGLLPETLGQPGRTL